MSTSGLLLVALAMLIGLVGIVVPVLPGLLLIWAATVVWALLEDGSARWAVLSVVTTLVVAGTVVKYLWPGRRLSRSGVPGRSLVAGVVLGLVGMVVVPVIGLPLGFVGGIYAAERARLGRHSAAWPATTAAVRAVGLSVLVELTAGALAVATWVIGVAVTA